MNVYRHNRLTRLHYECKLVPRRSITQTGEVISEVVDTAEFGGDHDIRFRTTQGVLLSVDKFQRVHAYPKYGIPRVVGTGAVLR